MGRINNISTAPLQTVNNTNGAGDKREAVKLVFDPKDIGATKQRNGQYPPSKKVTENIIEAALLKKFGFDQNSPADVARVKQLLQTEGSPFAALKTTGDLTAYYNNRTDKYEVINSVEKNLYRQLQGKAAEVKTQIEREKQSAVSNGANPNDVIAAKNGITNNVRAELENKLNNQASISASNQNESEKSVKTITGAIESVTGTNDPFAASEIGKQFNRFSVSSLRLAGKAMEASNYFSEKINDAVRYVAPDAVDDLLNQADKMNRDNAQALQNASSAVTNEDKYIDARAKQLGQEIPVTEDLANKIMYFPEAIPNAIDSAIKGDFKADDGSYSDKVGKIVGGLNPVGDVRDIVANGKDLIQTGDPKKLIPLGAAIVGGVPLGGDVLKPIIKEVGEELSEKGFKELGGEAVERNTKESAEKLAEAGMIEQRQQFRQIFGEQRYDEYANKVEAAKIKMPELKDIPTEDLVAIKGYTSADYRKLNDALRSSKVEELKAVEPYIKVAESGLNQLPNFEGVVYRGIDMNKIPNLSDKYRIGNVIAEEAFISSSTIKRGAFKRDTFITIKSQTGKDVSFLSDFPKQKEILFKPNTKFRVLEITIDEKTGKRYISMEEVK